MITTIDARGMHPPEPFERVLDALETFAPGDEIVLLLYREPHPLFEMLSRNSYLYSMEHEADGTVRVRITMPEPSSSSEE
ncbi:MAG: DUF2249 domain-containing protein [Gammaproteobacteria bacterium]